MPINFPWQFRGSSHLDRLSTMDQYRLFAAIAMLLACLALAAWTVAKSQLPPADFTFNNETEIKTIDPALVTGQADGRIVESLFEGLVKLDPRTRKPTSLGAAESWDASDDKRIYTFHIRREARWSNGDPVTAHDFFYSLRRFLSPITASQYSYQAWYIKNAQRYSTGGAGIEIGDAVEVELPLRPDQHETCIGELVSGTLIAKDAAPVASDSEAIQRFTVEVNGEQRTYSMGADLSDGVLPCRQITLDFAEVGVRVVDDYTLVTELTNPTPYWLDLLGFYPLFPTHRGCLERHGAPAWTQPGNLVTNGAYNISFRRPRDRIRLKRSDTYWNRDNVKLDVVDALAVDNRITAFNLYETGKIDWTPSIDPIVATDLLEADPPRYDFNPTSQLGTYFYSFNCSRKPLNDKRVRRALVLAIDREEIIDTASRMAELPALALTPPGIPNYTPPACAPENPELARQLLAEAGYPGGAGFPRMEILYNSDGTHEAIAELIRKQWQQRLGISITIQNEAWPSYLERWHSMRCDIARRSWIGDYLDPNTFLDMFVTNGDNNATGWSNPRYDQLIANAAVEIDSAKRTAMLTEAEAILMDELPIMPIYYYVTKNLVKPHVRGFYNNLQDNHPVQDLWIDPTGASPNPYLEGWAR